jgi:sugar transferase (PEP-CTERM/EpsH1 system associated)
MRILYLAHRIPYPPNKGDKIRSYHHVRHLAQRHDVHLVAFIDAPEDEPGADVLRALCRDVVLVPLDKRAALTRGLAALMRGRSLSEGYFASPSMQRAVDGVLAAVRPEAVWAFSSPMMQYAPALGVARTVADFVDVDSEKWSQFASRARGPLRWAYRVEATRLRAFERRSGGSADCVLFVSQAEAALYRTFCLDRTDVQVVPNGVDTTYFTPSDEIPTGASPYLLFTGAMDYWPNVEAVIACTREILPLIRRDVPEARLVAVGHRPARRLLREAARHDGVLQIAGSVPDVRSYFGEARVYVAPLRLGRGVQNKILEAMAMCVPIVASSLALEGLDVEPGRHVLVADSHEQFAATVVALWRDPARRRALTDAARRLVETRYSWESNLADLDTCLSAEIRAQSTVRKQWAVGAVS